MKFFLPAAESDEKRDDAYQAIRLFVEEQSGGSLSQRKIFKLWYAHNGKNLTAQVGEPHPLTGEPVIAIFCGKKKVFTLSVHPIEA